MPKPKNKAKTARKPRISATNKKAGDTGLAVIEQTEDKRGRGRPPHDPEDFKRGKVQVMAAYETHEKIALSLGICVKTLVKHYKRELDIGGVEANNLVMASMMSQIRKQTPGSAALIIWWTKCKMGWREGLAESEDAIAEYTRIRDPGELARLTAQELMSIYRAQVSSRPPV